MRRTSYLLALATGLLLVFVSTTVSATESAKIGHGERVLAVNTVGSYSRSWTNSVNDTLYIRASIDYNTTTEQGRLNLIVACYKGNPSSQVPNKCKLKGGTKIWENYTTGGHISAAIGEQDNGLSAYQILGTYRSMVNSNSYNSRGKDIYVLFHGSGRTSTKHTVCSVPWSESYGTGTGPAC
jgi:hypothetical protein